MVHGGKEINMISKKNEFNSNYASKQEDEQGLINFILLNKNQFSNNQTTPSEHQLFFYLNSLISIGIFFNCLLNNWRNIK